jgi:ATP-dependent helicase/DNAse subunit B
MKKRCGRPSHSEEFFQRLDDLVTEIKNLMLEVENLSQVNEENLNALQRIREILFEKIDPNVVEIIKCVNVCSYEQTLAKAISERQRLLNQQLV